MKNHSKETHIYLPPIPKADLKGWEEVDPDSAIPVLLRGCREAFMNSLRRLRAAEKWQRAIDTDEGLLELEQSLTPRGKFARARHYNSVSFMQEIQIWGHNLLSDSPNRPVKMRGSLELCHRKYSLTSGGDCPNGWALHVVERYVRAIKFTAFTFKDVRKMVNEIESKISSYYSKDRPWARGVTHSFDYHLGGTLNDFYFRENDGQDFEGKDRDRYAWVEGKFTEFKSREEKLKTKKRYFAPPPETIYLGKITQKEAQQTLKELGIRVPANQAQVALTEILKEDKYVTIR